MGFADAVPVDEEMEDASVASAAGSEQRGPAELVFVYLADRRLVAALVYLGCIVSPPSLMDDVDAVQAQIARNMLHIGRLGDGAAGRRRVSRKIAADLLDDRGLATRSSASTTGRRAFRLRFRAIASGAADGGVRHLGVRPNARALRGAGHGNLHRAVSVHAHSDSRRDADADDRAGACGRFCARSTRRSRIRDCGRSSWRRASGPGCC